MATEIVKISDTAREKIRSFQEEQKQPGSALRISVQLPNPAAYVYDLSFVDKGTKTDNDDVQETDGIVLYIDKESRPRIEGATIDFVEAITGSGFKIDNPNKPPLLENPVAQRIQKVLDEKINPGVASHGGHISLIDVKGGRVFLQLGGGCQGCGMANVTLKQGIETMLKEQVPEVEEVLDTTDHAAGTNPYFQPGKGASPAF
ncbi:MAG: iron-sulfur cluster assembly accessory protein [Acidobacteriota bacterium]